MNILNFALLKV